MSPNLFRETQTALMATFIYHPDYYSDVGQHVLQTRKYGKTYERFQRESNIPHECFVTPEPASQEEILLVHTEEYVNDLLSYRHTHRTVPSELPISKEIMDAVFLQTGGSILACRKALEEGRAINFTGGFHHCFADRAEGFCYLNDIAIGIRSVQKKGPVKRAAVIDCDLHQGNGTAVIFADDPDVFTFSIHQEHLYPLKEKSNLDIGLDAFTQDSTYLDHIRRAVPEILDNHRPELVVYQAGADPYQEDKLGALRLTKEGILERDQFIVRACSEREIPIAGLLGGGYAIDPEDTVEIHTNTCRAFWSTEEHQRPR